MSEQNLKIVQDTYAAFGRGDIPSVLAALDTDVDWQAVIGADPHTVPTAGTHRGVEGVGSFFQKLGQAMTFERFEPREFIASGENVACLGYSEARVNATGGYMKSSWVMVFTIRGGKIVRFREWSDSAQLNRAYGVAV